MNDRNDEPEKLEPEGHIPPRYEASFLNLWTIILALVALFVAVVLVHFLAAGLFGIFTAREGSPQPASPPLSDSSGLTPSEVESSVDARSQREQLYAEQASRIRSYGWINREAGVAGIPVERAMAIIAERGRPDFGGQEFTQPESQPQDPQALGSAGAGLFQEFGCSGCHREADSPAAPSLVGLFGKERELATGERVVADEAYIEQSILHPNVQVVAGYQPIMPSYQSRVNDQQLDALVAYIISLGE